MTASQPSILISTAAQAVVPLGAAPLRWLLEISKVSLELGYWNIGALFPQAH
jgi:hypothetical protein